MFRALALSLMLVLTPAVAAAQSDNVRDRIVVELTEDGYQQIRISRTLLGRMRFVATKPDYRREIVVNPATGVILRDYIRIITSNAKGGSSGSGGGHSDDDDDDYDDEYDDDYEYDDRDDRDDDDDREDRSGSNSGSDSDSDDDD